MGKRGEKIPENNLVPGNPRRVRQVAGLDRLVIDDRGNFFLQWFIVTGEKIIELRGSNGRWDLSAPKGVIGLHQLLTDGNIEDGGDDSGRRGGSCGRAAHPGAEKKIVEYGGSLALYHVKQ
jgi:hypothetical protein